MVILFSHLEREQADIFSLVLNSAGIANRVVNTTQGCDIYVAPMQVDAARKALDRYQAENPTAETDRTLRLNPPKSIDLSGILVALVLLCVHLAVITSTAPKDYGAVFGAHSRRILNGEGYRCVTALVLHADAGHLAGNMAGVALFGGAVCAFTGTGMGWLMILVCGVLGNLINALAYHQSGHLSVGASTAVFGAMGILCTVQAVRAVITGKGWKRMVLILGAGVALLAFLGTSARSDVGAHLFGFLTGVLLGGAFGLRTGPPPGGRAQVLFGVMAAFLLLSAWIRGLAGDRL